MIPSERFLKTMWDKFAHAPLNIPPQVYLQAGLSASDRQHMWQRNAVHVRTRTEHSFRTSQILSC